MNELHLRLSQNADDTREVAIAATTAAMFLSQSTELFQIFKRRFCVQQTERTFEEP
jgi:hypothetical protein